MKLETLMNTHYDSLQKNDRDILVKIIQNQDDFKSYTCEQIAQECHVSRATLLRVCRKIGLHSFSELKYILNTLETKKESHMDFNEVCNQYRAILQELKKIPFTNICRMIDEANTIYIYGTGNEQKSIAQEMKRIFLSIGKCVIDLFDEGEIDFTIPHFDANDVCIVISLSGESATGIQIVKKIRNHIQTISMTRLENNTISSLCHENLYASTKKVEGVQTSSYELVGVFYALLDLLFIHFLNYKRQMKGDK